MMVRGIAVLLWSVATLLLISASAVSSVPDAFVDDENVRELRRFAGRFEREHLEGGFSEPLDTVVDEKKPAEGILERARSFLSGFSTFSGNGIPNPAASLAGKDKLALPEKVEIGIGREGHFLHHHHRFGHSRWAGVRDLIRNHPERLAAVADISGTEPLALEEDLTPVDPVTALLAKIRGAVMSVVEDYNALPLETDLAPTCSDELEKQVKIFVKSIKSVLRERLCNADVASREEQIFCDLSSSHPMMATYQSLWNAGVNPVKVAWHKISRTSACSSVNPFSDFLDNLKAIEVLAGQYRMLRPEILDMEDMHMEHGREHHMSHAHEHHERHWWQRILHNPLTSHHFEERHEHGDHEKHWWQRVLGMFHEHKYMRHHGFEHAHQNSDLEVCFFRSVKRLTRGIKQHLAMTCASATSPDVISACKFAEEHHFLVKAWLAVKMHAWTQAARSCTHKFEDRHAPARGIGRPDIMERHPIYAEDLASNEADTTIERQLNTAPRHSGCGQAHREFSKALQLRGHVIGISSSSNDGEDGLRGIVRTRLIFLGVRPLHLHHFHDGFERMQPMESASSEEMVSDLQDRLAEFVREAGLVREGVWGEHRAEPSSGTEMMLFKPFHQHTRVPHFRISANPRVLPMSEGQHFRISATPRVVGESNNEIPVIGTQDTPVAVPVVVDAGSDDILQVKTPKDSAESRADM